MQTLLPNVLQLAGVNFVKHHYHRHTAAPEAESRGERQCRHTGCYGPEVKQLPALPVVILLQGLEPVCGLAQPGAVQQVLEGGRHVQVLVDGEGHAVVQVVEKVVRPLVDRADRVVHGNLKADRQSGC